MEGKVFLNSNGTPPRIAFSPDAFTFDIQRFDGTTWTLTQEPAGDTTTYKLTAEGKEEKTYNTFSNVLSATEVASGDTIKLGGEITNLVETVSYGNYVAIGNSSDSSKKLTLDLNGHSITGQSAFDVYCDFTLQDSVGTGSFTNTEKHGVWVNSNAKFTLKSGQVNAVACGVKLDSNTTFTMSGGSITSNDNTGINNSGSLTLNGGNISAKWGITNFSDNEIVMNNTNINATALGIQLSAGSLKMESGSIKCTSTGIYACGDSGNTIDISGTAYIEGTTGIAGVNGAKITMSGGEVKGTSYAAVQLGQNKSDYLNKNDSFTMTGGKLSGDSGVNLFNGGETFEMSGGEINTTTFAVSNNGNSWNQDATIKITGGTLTSSGAAGIYHAGPGTTTVSDGTITGTTGIECRAGELNVTGGTITGTDTEYSCPSNKGGSTTSGAGIAIAQHTTNKPINVNISGYNTNISGANALAVANPESNAATEKNKVAATISGGTLKSTATADTNNQINGNAILANNANVEITVTDGNLEGNVTVSKNENATENTSTTALKMQGGTTSGTVQVVTATKDASGTVINTQETTDTTEKKKLEVTGGTYTNQNSNVSEYLTEDVKQNEDGTVDIKGAGWTARDGSDNKIFDYIVGEDNPSSLISATFSTALTATDSINALKYDAANGKLLGIASGATWKWENAASSIQSQYNLATFTLGDTAITLTPQTEGVKIRGNGFVGDTTKLVATGSYGLEVNATSNSLTEITGGSGNDTILAGTNGGTLDGGAGNDVLVGNTNADTFVFSGGNDTFDSYTKDSDTISLASGFTPVTDGAKISGTTTSVILTFDNSNSLTFKASEAKISDYTYTKDYVKKDEYATLAAGVTSFNMGTAINSVDASAVTTAINIAGNDQANYIIAGNNGGSVFGGAEADTIIAGTNGGTLDGGEGDDLLKGNTGTDTFVHTAGSDTIQNYDIANDIVTVSTAPPTDDLTNNIKHSSTEFVIKIGNNDSLTFNGSAEIKLTNNGDTYYYKEDRVIKNNVGATLGSLFSDNTFNVNKLSSNYVTYSSIATIDASEVTVSGGLNITGNSDNPSSIIGAATGGNIIGGDGADTLKATDGSTTLNGGAGNDSLVGSTSGTDLFVYTGGTDTVSDYASGDTVRVSGLRLAEATYSVGSGNNISLGWGGTDNLIFQNVGETAVTVQQGTGNNYYTYAQQYSAHNNSITLASGYNASVGNVVTFNGADENYKNYETINAAAVTAANGISIVGNDNANYIFGPTAVNASINGGLNNDKINVSERGTNAKYLFGYTSGKDEIIGFDATKDTVSVAVDKITAAKLSNGNSKLTLTVNKNKDVLTLRSEDEIEKVSLQSGGYLTKDGYVSGQGFSLFGSAKGQIDLNDALYKGSNISLVAADSVKSQGVTLTGGTKGGTFRYAENNKKRDGFVYGGGSATIVNYEAGRDRIDLGSASFTSFEVVQNGDNKDLALTTGNGVISILGAGRQEVLLHDTSKGNGYKKMVFAQTGVIENKQKNPTMATVSGAATGYSAIASPTVKKIFVTGLTAAASIQAGNKNNTQIDASNAGKGVSLFSGAKNDKLIGNTLSSANDLFVYNAGKDIIQGYSDGDSISIGDFASSLSSAKITAGSKSIKFQFNNKNTLTIKANNGETLGSTLTIGDTNYTYTKNAIEDGAQATLTSQFSGTFNTNDSKLAEAVTTVDGAAVSRNLTYKGTTATESLVGGTKKTTFKGAGGADTLVGGTGKDVFFYAKGDAGTTTIANFEFGSNGRAGNDKLKIASGTIGEITSISGGVQFAMNSGKKGDTSNIGWFQIKSGYNTSTKEANQNIDATKVAIKANNTLYWFNQASDAKDVNGNDVAIGQLITSDSRVSASDVSNLDIIDLNYSTNLAKAGVAVKVTGAKPTT